jgi:hypothetical protein
MKWTLELIKEEALKYKTRSEFRKNSNASYSAAARHGVLELVCGHMKRLIRQDWKFEELAQEAKKYKTRWEFQQHGSKAYKAAFKRGILGQICEHMPNQSELVSKENNPSFKWTHEMLVNEALKYDNRIEFAKNSAGAYRTALSRDVLEEICEHMAYLCRPWTNEEVAQEALKYKTRKDFQKNSSGAYQAALRRGTLDPICSHMGERLTEKWTNEELAEEAKKYKTRIEFQKNSGGAYVTARKKDILDQICSHMVNSTNTSSAEKELFDVIKSVYPKAQKLVDSKRKKENGTRVRGFHIDIYVPELRKGIEFDGTYHHSFKGLKRGRPGWSDEDLLNYHQLKDDHFLSKGIQILHIKEKDWDKDKQACINECFEFLKIKVN